MTELATDLCRDGADVVVITTKPHYNRDRVAEEAQPLTRVWPGLLWRSEIGGVTVFHTRVAAKNRGNVSRAIGWVIFHLLALLTALVKVRRADVIFVPSPLLTLGALGSLLRRPLRARFVYNVQELYPDLAIELGMMRNRLVIAVLRALEHYVYRRAAIVTTITDGIRDAVIRKGVPERRVVTIPNFVDVSELQPGPKDNPFARRYDWTTRFVVLYAGNIGYAQGLDGLLAAARQLESDRQTVIAFVGEGNARAELEASARAMGLSNVQFIEHQPYSLVPDIYAAADLCVVSLTAGILVGALPSKVFRIMACGRPILALCDPRSDLATIVRDAGAGEVCDPEDASSIGSIVRAMKASPAATARMGADGRAFVLDGLSRAVVTRRYSDLFTELAS